MRLSVEIEERKERTKMIKDAYPYLYETHLHTSEGSKCGRNTGAEMGKACKEAGYTGMIVTNHNWYGNTCIDASLPWEEWVDTFYKAYEKAKEWGDENDFQVFFGYESCYDGTEFLIYGVDGQWMKAHPELKEASIAEQYRLVHEAGGIVVQAHPFRKEDYIPKVRLFQEEVDGIEGINATHSCHLSKGHNCKEWDEMAIAYSLEKDLPMTAGSDIHSTFLFGGGMAFKRKLASIEDFCRAFLAREDYLMTNGDHWFDKQGKML